MVGAGDVRQFQHWSMRTISRGEEPELKLRHLQVELEDGHHIDNHRFAIRHDQPVCGTQGRNGGQRFLVRHLSTGAGSEMGPAAAKHSRHRRERSRHDMHRLRILIPRHLSTGPFTVLRDHRRRLPYRGTLNGAALRSLLCHGDRRHTGHILLHYLQADMAGGGSAADALLRGIRPAHGHSQGRQERGQGAGHEVDKDGDGLDRRNHAVHISEGFSPVQDGRAVEGVHPRQIDAGQLLRPWRPDASQHYPFHQ